MKVFISYATEDGPIAAAIEGVFKNITSNGFVDIETFLDVHNAEIGRRLNAQILDQLRKTDIVFLIYTKRLKKSHSYTGFEIGAFSTMIDDEIKETGGSDRKIVSLFIDEPPAVEADVLGIKLNLEALRPSDDHPATSLGLSGDFARFLSDVSSTMIDRHFPDKLEQESQERWFEQKQNAKKTLASRIESEYIPKLESELKLVLAGTVAKVSIEQHFLEFRWKAIKLKSKAIESYNLRNDIVVTPSSPDVLKIFGVYDTTEKLSWGDLKRSLEFNAADTASFFIGAIESAVNSALSSTSPTDNDQLVLAQNRNVFRLIVTRHYAYLDGSRTMHIYLIPLLTDPFDGPESRSLVLLRLATRFRLMFLDLNAPLSPQAFELVQRNPDTYLKRVQLFERETLFMASLSHTHHLDDPLIFLEDFYERDKRPSTSDIAKLFDDWQHETKEVLAVAHTATKARQNFVEFTAKWDCAVRKYFAFVEPINHQMGSQAAERLFTWYKPAAK